MSEGANITYNIKNETGNTLTVYNSNLSWGKFQTNPTPIENDKSGDFKASGRAWTPSGTEGSVTYQAFDKTLFEVVFNINWGGNPNDNSISNNSKPDSGQGNPSNFTFVQTDKYYKPLSKPSGNPGSSPVTVYYLIKKN